ncbi:Proteasome subunit beta type-4 [Lathyrus oleraceus]|uniref:Proteasome subunit beta n=1 Tax=Pisum sativum TaxID=3888 RepID=A0A9D4X491_PEA|nr:Proteasome subunit beta type-4 [Pisum sativum]
MDSKSESQRTLYPYVTGSSVVAIKFKDGILMAADMGGSYGSTLRYKSVERLKPIGKHSLLGASGEISDFQEIMRYLDELILNDNMWDDGNSLGPKEVHNYLTRVMYNRRNKFNPLWNSLVLGGIKKGQKYLGTVNMIGINYEDNHVATGLGNHLARPILRDEWNENLSFEEGVRLLEKCMRVLLYRDRSAVNKIQVNFAGCSAFAGWCYGSVAFSVWHFGSAFCVRIAYFHLPALPFVSAALQLRCCGSELVLQALFCKLPFALVCITHVAD